MPTEEKTKDKPGFLNVAHCKKLVRDLYPEGRVSLELLMAVNALVTQKMERAATCAKKYRHKTIKAEHLIR